MQEIRDRDISATVSSHIVGLKGLPKSKFEFRHYSSRRWPSSVLPKFFYGLKNHPRSVVV